MSIEKIYRGGTSNPPEDILINTTDVATLPTVNSQGITYAPGSQALDVDTGNVYIIKGGVWKGPF